MVNKYFGENLTCEQFKEILDVLFKMNSVQEFVNAEKDKRALTEIARVENITYDIDVTYSENENIETEPSSYYGSGRVCALCREGK